LAARLLAALLWSIEATDRLIKRLNKDKQHSLL
jgi:hypothetical protein